MKVLVTGVAGKLGTQVGRQLVDLGHEVIGVDRRPWSDAPPGVRMFQADIRKRTAEEVFRTIRPTAAIHMATVTHLVDKSPDHLRINLYGTRAFIEHCDRYNVKQAVFVGRHTYYGAAADSPLYHTEDEPPISAHAFPELADLVAADLYAGTALWQHPKISTSVLRLCYTLGPLKHGTLATFFRSSRVPMVLGFDPLFHFMHEQDAATAIVSALTHKLHGVFNVAGPPPVPLSMIARAAGRQPIRVPEPVINFALGRFGLPQLSAGAIDHLKYPIVVDATQFKNATGFEHRYSEAQTIREFAMAT